MCAMRHDETLPACDHAWDYRLGATVIRARLLVFISPVMIPVLDFYNTTIQRVPEPYTCLTGIAESDPSRGCPRTELCAPCHK